jgi:very-short-patch-repair endonuclease
MTLPETALWTLLRRKQLRHLRFRRQHPVGPYILDFYCALAKLCIELDGPVHDDVDQQLRDQRRTQWLAEAGIRVLRIKSDDVLIESRLVPTLDRIVQAATPSTASGGPPPP